MIAGFVIALREGLEAALIVGIVLAFLARTGGSHRYWQVFAGVVSAIIVSIAFAFGFQWIAGGFSGSSAQIFEGVTTLIAAGLLVSMIVWMERKGPTLQMELEQKAAATMTATLGIFFIVFIAVLREGVETVLFLTVLPVSEGAIWIGALLGFAVAVGIAYIYFAGTKQFSLKTFFRITSVFLIIFAAGMIAYGIHELQEAGVVPVLIEHVWDINYLLPENSPIGMVLKGLVGYNGNPSLIEVVAYVTAFTALLAYFARHYQFQPPTKQLPTTHANINTEI
ncbi:MAG: FTR1 family iron permease [Candidatus Hermodarchaeia archaeon]|jgi:high-affinity iron transporter